MIATTTDICELALSRQLEQLGLNPSAPLQRFCHQTTFSLFTAACLEPCRQPVAVTVIPHSKSLILSLITDKANVSNPTVRCTVHSY